MEDRKKKTEELAKDLKRIYSDPDGQLPDFTRLDGKPGNRLRSFIIGALLAGVAMAAAVWAGIFLFSRTGGFTGDRVELAIGAQDGLPAGPARGIERR